MEPAGQHGPRGKQVGLSACWEATGSVVGLSVAALASAHLSLPPPPAEGAAGAGAVAEAAEGPRGQRAGGRRRVR